MNGILWLVFLVFVVLGVLVWIIDSIFYDRRTYAIYEATNKNGTRMFAVPMTYTPEEVNQVAHSLLGPDFEGLKCITSYLAKHCCHFCGVYELCDNGLIRDVTF